MRISELYLKIEDSEYIVMSEKEIWNYICNIIRSINKKEIQTKQITGLKIEMPCSSCNGTGKKDFAICQVCWGEKFFENTFTEPQKAWAMINNILQLYKKV